MVTVSQKLNNVNIPDDTIFGKAQLVGSGNTWINDEKISEFEIGW